MCFRHNRVKLTNNPHTIEAITATIDLLILVKSANEITTLNKSVKKKFLRSKYFMTHYSGFNEFFFQEWEADNSAASV